MPTPLTDPYPNPNPNPNPNPVTHPPALANHPNMC